MYDAAALNGPMDSDPDVAFVPDHPPDAVHDVAPVEDQVSVTDAAMTTVEALGVNVTVGAPPFDAIETETIRMAEPPVPEQVNVYDAAALKGPTDSDPEVAFAPDQPPDAIHEVALVDNQVSVTEEPVTTDVALELNVTVGAPAEDVTATETDWLAEPPAPEQLNVYVAAAAKGSVASDPAVAIEPDQPPEAVHELASVEVQVSVTDEPVATDAALEVNVTVGVGSDDACVGLPLSLPPPQAASSRLAIKPGSHRMATRCFTTLSPMARDGATMAIRVRA